MEATASTRNVKSKTENKRKFFSIGITWRDIQAHVTRTHIEADEKKVYTFTKPNNGPGCTHKKWRRGWKLELTWKTFSFHFSSSAFALFFALNFVILFSFFFSFLFECLCVCVCEAKKIFFSPRRPWTVGFYCRRWNKSSYSHTSNVGIVYVWVHCRPVIIQQQPSTHQHKMWWKNIDAEKKKPTSIEINGIKGDKNNEKAK